MQIKTYLRPKFHSIDEQPVYRITLHTWILTQGWSAHTLFAPQVLESMCKQQIISRCQVSTR